MSCSARLSSTDRLVLCQQAARLDESSAIQLRSKEPQDRDRPRFHLLHAVRHACGETKADRGSVTDQLSRYLWLQAWSTTQELALHLHGEQDRARQTPPSTPSGPYASAATPGATNSISLCHDPILPPVVAFLGKARRHHFLRELSRFPEEAPGCAPRATVQACQCHPCSSRESGSLQ